MPYLCRDMAAGVYSVPELMVYMDSKFLFGETCCIFLQHFGLDSALHHIFVSC